MRHLLTVLLAIGILSIDASADNPYLNKREFRERVQEQEYVPAPEVSEGYHEEYLEPSPHCPPRNGPTLEDAAIAAHALYITEGDCNFVTNPHSYACTKVTFLEQLFPFFEIDWWGDLGTPWNMQGEWFAVTFVEDNGRENNGKQFQMAKNPNSPNQPMGVVNKNNGLMGSMWIEGNTVRFENWQGKELSSDPESLQLFGDVIGQREIFDQYTGQVIVEDVVAAKEVHFSMYEKVKVNGRKIHVTHYFECINFNRHNNMHLQCKWDVQQGDSPRSHKGYFGFLTKQAWDQFLVCGKR